MLDPQLLSAVQDEVFADKSLWPSEAAGDEITHCNQAALRVAQGVGCHEFDHPAGYKEPLRADELYNLMKTSWAFLRQPMGTCQDLVNAGMLIFAVLPSWLLHQTHGHICSLTPGVGDHSGRWNAYTPLCMNLGRAGACFRSKGINWAFQIVPEFYSWRQAADPNRQASEQPKGANP